jgi:hypothetical protein
MDTFEPLDNAFLHNLTRWLILYPNSHHPQSASQHPVPVSSIIYLIIASFHHIACAVCFMYLISYKQ